MIPMNRAYCEYTTLDIKKIIIIDFLMGLWILKYPALNPYQLTFLLGDDLCQQ